MKKTLSVLLSLSLMLGIMLPMSFTASALEYDGYSYEVHNNEIYIKGYNATSPIMELHIPSVIDSMPVTAIDDIAFVNDTYISSYYLPSGLKIIGNGAFYECSAENIYLPDSLETIGDYAFVNCHILTGMSLGANVSGIQSGTFQGCDRLSEFTVSADNANYGSLNGVLLTKDMKNLMAYPAGCKNAEYNVPSTVETIWEYAFYNCSSLNEIYLPLSLKTVEASAFDCSSAITDVYYEGTEEDWSKVSVSTSGNDYLLNARMHYNSVPAPCDKHTKSGEGKVIIEPTCTKKGETEYVCAVCGTKFTEETDALGHTPETLKAVAPTYFKAGKTEGKKCSVCGEILTAQKSVPKLVLAVPSKKKATPKVKAFVFTWKRNKNATGYKIQYSTSRKFTKKTTKTITVKKNSTVKKTVKKLKSQKYYFIRIRAYKKSGTKTAYSKWSKTVKVKTK